MIHPLTILQVKANGSIIDYPLRLRIVATTSRESELSAVAITGYEEPLNLERECDKTMRRNMVIARSLYPTEVASSEDIRESRRPRAKNIFAGSPRTPSESIRSFDDQIPTSILQPCKLNLALDEPWKLGPSSRDPESIYNYNIRTDYGVLRLNKNYGVYLRYVVPGIDCLAGAEKHITTSSTILDPQITPNVSSCERKNAKPTAPVLTYEVICTRNIRGLT